VRGFRRERPSIELEMREMRSLSQPDAIAEGAADFGFLQIRGRDRRALRERGIVAIKTGEELLSLAVPGTHALATRRQVTLPELAREPFILPAAANRGESIRDRFVEAARAAGFEPNVVQESGDVRLTLGLVSAELGVAPVYSWNRTVRIRNVHYLTIVPAVPLSFGVIYRQGFGGRSIEPLLARIQREALAERAFL
jgi:DNA-binding transcriptional LysR family regulator